MKWFCKEHGVELSVDKGTPENVLDDLPPVCPACGEPMKRQLVGVSKLDIQQAVAEEVGLDKDDVAKGFWKGLSSTDPFKKEGWFKLARALGIDRDLEEGENR